MDFLAVIVVDGQPMGSAWATCVFLSQVRAAADVSAPVGYFRPRARTIRSNPPQAETRHKKTSGCERLTSVISKRTSLRCRGLLLAMVFLFVAAGAQAQQAKADLDRDGIPDGLEQALLQKFRPSFMISAADCDSLPAEFVPGRKSAVARERNGTIYGQVFVPVPPVQSANAPNAPGASPGEALLEIHYYDLWARDCGRMSHNLDAEHVAVLVRAGSLSSDHDAWKAVYWYAAAHENTVCDRSRIARAAGLKAEDHGPAIWISAGKHGAFFHPEDCNGGCGQDRCASAVALPPGKLINLGEPHAPLNGAVWIASGKWNLTDKMQTSFTPALLGQARFAEAGSSAGRSKDLFAAGVDSMLARQPNSSMQAVILASGSTLDGMDTSDDKTAAAVAIGAKHTGHALGATDGKVRGSLSRASRAVVHWFGRMAGGHKAKETNLPE